MCPEEEVLVQTVNSNKCENLSLKNLLVGNPINKKPRLGLSPLVFITLKQLVCKKLTFHTLQCLLDSGFTSTLVSNKSITKAKYDGQNATIWKTSAGNFKTLAKSKLEFTMPELHQNRIINHETHVTNAK